MTADFSPSTVTRPGLYIHIPFCESRCRYCAFVSSIYRADRADAYLMALGDELERRAWGRQFATLYVGGGTPSCLSPEKLDRLLSLLAPVADGLEEWTVEANPGSLTVEKAQRLRHAGVTRLSLGVQSFALDGLQALGRRHDARQARTAVAIAREAGFDNLSCDLIFGWPGQDVAAWEADLAEVVRLNIPHVSAYALTPEPHTPFGEEIEDGRVLLPDDDLFAALFETTALVLGAAGRTRYEISNFALDGHRCLHNINYWQAGEYLGLGAGAHSYEQGVRYANEDSADAYMRRIIRDGQARVWDEKLAPAARAREAAVIWLRMSDGIDASAFRVRTGWDLEELYARVVPELVAGGWLAWSHDRQFLRLTEKALPVADGVLAELVTE